MAQTDDKTTESSETMATLNRLSSKAGVQGVILLSTPTGTVIQSRGTFTAFDSASKNAEAQTVPSMQAPSMSRQNSSDGKEGQADTGGVQTIARLAYQFMKGVETLVEGVAAQDEAKLLRLRTKRYELVIVPDLKYTFVVVHDVNFEATR
ncbi:hypothetical protein BJ878DRAFT_487164 [Calycina marina]|uniref:Roadblock/LAMTOR2 domain-containing protein n=1 Tax=Calycina marina TaxID=1763456 RepID=A0A9P8CJ84_9HELO|nr:hypothetical protein BJ878DRAFT_487164 [Calycina marina]